MNNGRRYGVSVSWAITKVRREADAYVYEAVGIINAWPSPDTERGEAPQPVERELGAGVRQFFGVKGAVMWAQTYRARLVSLQQNPNGGGGGRSRESIEEGRATYARIFACLQPTMADVDDHNISGRTDEMVDWLSGDRSQEYLADEVGLSVQQLSGRVGYTEAIVKKRMQARGLLKPRDP